MKKRLAFYRIRLQFKLHRTYIGEANLREPTKVGEQQTAFYRIRVLFKLHRTYIGEANLREPTKVRYLTFRTGTHK
jgi:hypothetical protein